MPSILSLLDLLPNGGGDGKAFESLTIESMRKFNEDTPDVDGVQYFSWGAMYDPGLIDTWKCVLPPARASSLVPYYFIQVASFGHFRKRRPKRRPRFGRIVKMG